MTMSCMNSSVSSSGKMRMTSIEIVSTIALSGRSYAMSAISWEEKALMPKRS